MTEQNTVETVVLKDQTTVALFTDANADGKRRVFYDLEALVAQYLPQVMSRGIVATMSDDPAVKAASLAEVSVLRGILASADALRLEADFDLS